MSDSDRQAAAESLKRRLRAALGKKLLAAAVLTGAEHKRDLSRANPAPHRDPAPKGEFPRARTFNLRDAVAVSPATLDAVAAAGSVRVGVLKGAFYGAVLSARGWKGLRDTVARIRGRLTRLLGESGGGVS